MRRRSASGLLDDEDQGALSVTIDQASRGVFQGPAESGRDRQVRARTPEPFILRSTVRYVDSDARVRFVAVVIVIVAALIFISLPFHEQGLSKGPGPLPSLPCRAPIIGGWAGAERSPGQASGSYEDIRYTCGGAERTRLVGGGVVIGICGGLMVIMLVISRTRTVKHRLADGLSA
jgi:hypothetical protein